MITFSERGSELLTEATQGARERAAGEYLGAVLAQRRKAWARALDALEMDGYSRKSIRSHVLDFHLKGTTVDEMVRFAGEPDGRWFHDLVLEYEAGNKALIAALQEDAS
jgi:hypothetical protein